MVGHVFFFFLIKEISLFSSHNSSFPNINKKEKKEKTKGTVLGFVLP